MIPENAQKILGNWYRTTYHKIIIVCIQLCPSKIQYIDCESMQSPLNFASSCLSWRIGGTIKYDLNIEFGCGDKQCTNHRLSVIFQQNTSTQNGFLHTAYAMKYEHSFRVLCFELFIDFCDALFNSNVVVNEAILNDVMSIVLGFDRFVMSFINNEALLIMLIKS